MAFGVREPMEKYKPHRYIQADLLKLHYVNRIVVFTESAVPFEPRVMTSRDGIAWLPMPHVIEAESGDSINIGRTISFFR